LKTLVKLPTQISHGKVHIANNDIIAIHIQKLPVLIAYICIAKVNPQGNKNVKTPLKKVNTYLENQLFLSPIK
jgi:hypothetical protein